MEKAGKEFLDLTGLTSVWSRIKYLVTNIVGLSLTNYATKSELDSETSLRAAVGTALTNHIADTTSHITAAERSSWNAKTSNVGTITGITMNGASKGTSGVVDLGTVITDVSGKSDKSATVSTVTYDATNKKITKTINGSTTDVVTASTIVTDGGGLTSSEASNTYVKKSGDTMNGNLTVGSNLIIFSTTDNDQCLNFFEGRLCFGKQVAQHFNVGSLLVADKWAEAKKVPTHGIYSVGVISSGVSTGTAPLSIISTTKVDNLNADMVDGLHSNALVVANSKQTILSTDGNGQYGYVKVATFTITRGYANCPAIFEVFGRGIAHTMLTVIPANENNTDPSNVYLYSNNSNRFYIRKFATSTWELYCQYAEGVWGTLCVRQLFGNYGMSVTLDGTNVSSLPSGCVQASAMGMAATANRLSTTRTLWGQNFDGTGNVSGIIKENDIVLFTTKSGTRMGWIGNGSSAENIIGLYADDGYSLALGVDGTRIINIDDSKNVGIGTTSPTEKLEVNGNIYVSGRLIESPNIVTNINAVPTDKRLCIVNSNASNTFGLSGTLTAGCELQVIINNTSSSDITIAIPTTFKSNGLDSISIEPGNYGEINVISDGTNLYLKAV